MNKNKSQLGSVHLVVVIVLVIALISALGYIFWQNFMQPKTDNSDKVTTKIIDDTSSKKVVTDPTENWETYTNNDSVFVSFKYPSDWLNQDWATNGVLFESPDFSSRAGFANISAGSLVTVVYSTNEANSTLENKTLNNTLAKDLVKQNITLDGVPAVKFEHGTDENGNNAVSIYVLKDGNGYIITQEYKLGGPNPYPDLIDNIVKTFKFNK